ncbi:hypothetical protein BMH32_11150 [Leucobacter sp. OLJS4]|uniref:hypothetical protein n=1 Tax=unclassified Leucobacter TaxID=2621730 RepID=UPI000C19F4EB|nr:MULTISPECIES: hypothetical protein [unclassified Leucobacter]PII82422.1 hypothetical protein BMH25_11145 [Leucobacter sp. OLCALW19]PII87396.1 hypothetical protein BMH26_09655 [Leucobacter sp. OLTLW20]PII94547.1 hypothetical protein BMH27_00745 [Leucobacter sp. OLAS13]PIJ00654.1 hypothetical protein BMH29_00770 [Leucobacter sp. OLDS2]PIJ01379.1 hypothetical protein BMH28_06915 [Leucobacter sp. OLCS4]
MEQARAIARRSAPGSATPWIVLAVAAIVLGLLGMHALRDVDPAHGAAVPAASSVASGSTETRIAPHDGAAAAAAPVPSNQGLTGQERMRSTPAEGHDTAAPIGGCLDLVSVCVLALLLTFAVAIRRNRGRTSTLSKRAFVVLRVRAPGRPFVEPPSPFALSVLRT